MEITWYFLEDKRDTGIFNSEKKKNTGNRTADSTQDKRVRIQYVFTQDRITST